MAIIRLAAFLEREEYAPYMDVLTSPEKRVLRMAYNIAVYSGYQSVGDQLLWTVITHNVPDMIERLRAAASRGQVTEIRMGQYTIYERLATPRKRIR